MPNYVLHYFNARGRAEISRLIMIAGGIPFEDDRVMDFADWPAKKSEAPLGQMPYLEVDDQKLPQSVSIARYLARETGLAGKTSWEQAQVDAVVDTVQDALNDFSIKVFHVKDEKEKQEAFNKFISIDVPKHAGNLEKLIDLYGKSDYAVGDSLTWADLNAFDFFSNYVDKVPDFGKNYPKLNKIIQLVQNNSKIAEYLKNRPVTQS